VNSKTNITSIFSSGIDFKLTENLQTIARITHLGDHIGNVLSRRFLGEDTRDRVDEPTSFAVTKRHVSCRKFKLLLKRFS